MDFLLELDEIQTFMVHENIYDIVTSTPNIHFFKAKTNSHNM
jgi:hypothetical protein